MSLFDVPYYLTHHREKDKELRQVPPLMLTLQGGRTGKG